MRSLVHLVVLFLVLQVSRAEWSVLVWSSVQITCLFYFCAYGQGRDTYNWTPTPMMSLKFLLTTMTVLLSFTALSDYCRISFISNHQLSLQGLFVVTFMPREYHSIWSAVLLSQTSSSSFHIFTSSPATWTWQKLNFNQKASHSLYSVFYKKTAKHIYVI